MIGDALILLGMVVFGWLAIFQLLLACGAPLGRLAWGGQARVLSTGQRWGSLAVVALAGVGGLAMAQAAGLGIGVFPDGALRWILGAFCVLFALSFVANLMSTSRPERLHGVPLTVILAASTGYAAFG